MAYGYWVEMGGFVISTSDISKEHEFVAITAQGAIHLAKLGHVFEISDEQIADRSKCDWLGKSLFCIQVTWTFIQCVARASFGHPLTLLETHTLVHVVFAICLHLLWWHV